MIDTCHYTFVQTHRMYNSLGNPDVNYGLLEITMCQCWLILGNKCATLVSDVDHGGDSACVGAGLIWKIFVIPLNSLVNLKLL